MTSYVNIITMPTATAPSTASDSKPFDSITSPRAHVMQGSSAHAAKLKVKSKRTGLEMSVSAVAMIGGSKNNIRGPQCVVM